MKGFIYFYFYLFNDNLLILSNSIIFRSSSFTTDAVLLFGILSLNVLMMLHKVVSTYIIKLNFANFMGNC